METIEKIQAIKADMNGEFVEREDLVDVIWRSVLSANHACFIGSAGIAKTALIDNFSSKITGSLFFKRLMRRDSTPEEFVGPISLKGLENDDFRRVLDPVDGKWERLSGNIVRAHFAGIDEAN